MRCDILFLTFNRLEYTKACYAALLENTNWSLVRRLIFFDDNSTDGTWRFISSAKVPVQCIRQSQRRFGPVAQMNYYVKRMRPAPIFAKIDSDTMVPRFWLDDCLAVMDASPKLDLLGIEVFNPVKPSPVQRSYRPAKHIGGIGLMRTRIFKDKLPEAKGRFGFTGWQTDRTKDGRIQAGWIDPALPVFLLDHLPREPWRSLSKEYCQKGWQRNPPQWGFYPEEKKEIWSWFCE